ncbi:MAG: glycosyltransferase family 2 protein [Chloroflexota bacterium]
MKCIIQIPCLNEAKTLPEVVRFLPRHISGIDTIEYLIIDDGSSDETVAVAESLGVDHIIQHPRNLGLAQAFRSGLEACLRLGADLIVNTDGDNQYPGSAIVDLVQPILDAQADIVIGDRQVSTIPHFSPIKKAFSTFGSRVVRGVSGTDVTDAVSGFRAYSREAALRINILTSYSYTLDTLIQAGKQGLVVHSVAIQTNGPTRPSRLQKNMFHFIKAQAATILRLYAFYEPLRTFSYIAAPFLLSGTILIVRFLWVYLFDIGNQFIQSVTIGSGLLVIGILIFLVGVQADIAAKHRQLTQETLYRLKKMELDRLSDKKSPTSGL